MACRFDDIIYLKLSFAITSLHWHIAAQKKHLFLQQACHRMILQIVETGFPANSDTSTQHTCCQLPVCFQVKPILCTVYCFTSLLSNYCQGQWSIWNPDISDLTGEGLGAEG